MATLTDRRIVDCLVENGIGFATSVPCKQLAGVIELVENSKSILHVPSNKEDEGMGLCAGAYMGGIRSCIIMQNTALGVVVNSLATLIQFYRIPLPMLISYRGEIGEKVACQVEMALHTKAILNQLHIPAYHFRNVDQLEDLDSIIKHSYMCGKPVAILADAAFWRSAE
ncbi:MAG: sulfopyruvate decarboxylase subunit alpha [Albidovulum sp.]|nr:sulfopyruvate decarboxylase subunit alpha [Albidovulum sp.]